jgi:ribosomal protein L16 Arg81 hydroxylase
MGVVNYVRAAGIVNPNSSFGFTTDPNTYETLDWKTTVIPKATLEAAYVLSQKQKRGNEFAAQMQTDLSAGFQSDALVASTFRKYNSDSNARIAITTAYTYAQPRSILDPGRTFTLASYSLVNGTVSFDVYDNDQLFQLLSDMALFGADLVAKLQTKVGILQVINTGTASGDLDAIAVVTW